MPKYKEISIRLSLENTEKVKDLLKTLGADGDAALQQIEKAAAKPSQGFQRLAASLDPLYAAQVKVEKGMVTLNRELDRGKISAEAHANYMNLLTTSVTKAATGSGKFGLVIQQASYQIADIAAVAASGGNALAAVGTQLGQFLGFLGPMGAMAGAAVTVLGLLVKNLIDVGDASDEAKLAQESYQKSLDNLVSLEKEYNRVLRERQGLPSSDERIEGLKQRAREADMRVEVARDSKPSVWSGMYSSAKEKLGFSRTKSDLEVALGEQADAQNQLSVALDYQEAIDNEKRLTEEKKKADEESEHRLQLMEQEQEKRDKSRESMQDQITGLENERLALSMTDRERFIFNETLKAEKTARSLSVQEGEVYIDQVREAAAALYDQKEAAKQAAKEQVNFNKEAQRSEEERLQSLKRLGADMGMTFSSAFEDAVIAGKKFSDILQSLYQDVMRLLMRQTITQPLTSGLGDIFSKISESIFGGGSSWFSSANAGFDMQGLSASTWAGSFAGGTRSAPPGMAWVGEEGPELVKFRGGEQVYPAHISKNIDRALRLPGFAKGAYSPASLSGDDLNNGRVQVNIINNSGAEISTERRQAGGVETLDVIIDQAVARKLSQRGSFASKALRQNYGASERLVSR